MKKIIPFTKEIPFKSKISDITSISLDHDLSFDNNLLTGNFYITGKYKMTEASQIESDYNYKIPFEITISDKYILDEVSFDIDDFYYEIIDEEALRVNIEVYVDGLILKEKKEEVKAELARLIKEEKKANEVIENTLNEDIRNEEENVVKIEDVITNINSNNDEKYLTYSVYIFRDDDSLEEIMEKYHTNKDMLMEYNNLDEIKSGYKLIIPTTKNNE